MRKVFDKLHHRGKTVYRHAQRHHKKYIWGAAGFFGLFKLFSFLLLGIFGYTLTQANTPSVTFLQIPAATIDVQDNKSIIQFDLRSIEAQDYARIKNIVLHLDIVTEHDGVVLTSLWNNKMNALGEKNASSLVLQLQNIHEGERIVDSTSLAGIVQELLDGNALVYLLPEEPIYLAAYDVFLDIEIQTANDQENTGELPNLVENAGVQPPQEIQESDDLVVQDTPYINSIDVISSFFARTEEVNPSPHRDDSSDCQFMNTSLIPLQPGIDTIPRYLSPNTIYVLETGNYISNYMIEVPDSCTALVGIGPEVHLFTTKLRGANIKISGGENSIIDNLKLHGKSDGIGGFHTENNYGIFVDGEHAKIHDISAYDYLGFGVYMEDFDGVVVDIRSYKQFSVLLDPYADTYIDEAKKWRDYTYGKSDHLSLDHKGTKSLIQFDLSSLPSSAVVTHAQLKLTKIGGGSPYFTAQKILNNDRKEGRGDATLASFGEISYNFLSFQNKPRYGDVGMKAGTDYAYENILNQNSFDKKNIPQWFDFNQEGITALQEWVRYPQGNFGLVLTTEKQSLTLGSREHATMLYSPALLVDYFYEATNGQNSPIVIPNTSNSSVIRSVMMDNGYREDDEFLVGERPINLSLIGGNIPINLSMEAVDDHTTVTLPEETSIETQDGQDYEGILMGPKNIDNGVFSGKIPNQKIVKAFKVGSDKQKLRIKDKNGKSKKIKISVPVEGYRSGALLVVNYSQDGETREILGRTSVFESDFKTYVEFYTDHFTRFVLGEENCYFTINKDSASTSSLSVSLHSTCRNATEMAFSHSFQKIPQSVRFTEEYPRTLSSTTQPGGVATVYARFSDGRTTVSTSDTITYDPSSSGIYYDTVVLSETPIKTGGSLALGKGKIEVQSSDSAAYLIFGNENVSATISPMGGAWNGIIQSPVEDKKKIPSFEKSKEKFVTTYAVGTTGVGLLSDKNSNFKIFVPIITISEIGSGSTLLNRQLNVYKSEDGVNWTTHGSCTIIATGGSYGCLLVSDTLSYFGLTYNRHNNDDFVDQAFWDTDPTDAQIIDALYGNSSDTKTAYTQNWNGYTASTCLNGTRMTVSRVSSPPGTMSAKTIYLLTGNQSFNRTTTVTFNTCSALISKSPSRLGRTVANLRVYSSSKSNIILDNIQVDGGNRTYEGIFFANSSNRTLNKIQVYNASASHGLSLSNSSYGLLNASQIHSNGTGSTTKHGIYLYGGSHHNIFNNIQVFNNRFHGLYSNGTTTVNNVINNSQFYNNGYSSIYHGLAIYQGSITLNNLISYNNGGYGFTADQGSVVDINNVAFYNNGSIGIRQFGSTVTRYGSLRSFANGGAATFGAFITGDSNTYSNLGWLAGTMAIAGSFSVDYVTRVQNGAGVYGPGSTYTDRGPNHVWGTTITNNYDYGSYVPKQIAPVYKNGTNLALATGLEYSVSNFVGEYPSGDTTAPVIELISPTANSTYTLSNDVPFVWSGSDNVGISYYMLIIGIGQTTTEYGPYTTTGHTIYLPNSNGTYGRSVAGYDAAGNTGYSENRKLNVNVSGDTTPPTIGTISLSAGNYYGTYFNGGIKISATATDANGIANCSYYNGSSWLAASWNFGICTSPTFSPGANFNGNIRAQDPSNNMGQGGFTFFTYDATAPSVPNLVSPNNGATVNTSTPTLTWNGSTDAGVGVGGYNVQVSTNSSFSSITQQNTGISTSWTPTPLSNATTYYWRVRSADRLLNTSSLSTARSFTTSFGDTVAPVVELIAPADRTTYSLSNFVPFVWSGSDNVGIVSYRLFIETEQSGNLSFGLLYTTGYTVELINGRHSFWVEGYDAAGNTGTSSEFIFTLDVNSSVALVSQAYISAGTTGDNGGTTNYYKGTINIRADVSDAGGLNTSSCKYTTGSSRLTAQYNGTSTAGYCYVNSLSPGADINLRFSIQNIANNITTGAIGAYTYDATAPINGTVNINNNAKYTNTGVVTVYITDCPTDNLGIGLSGLYVGTGSNPTGGFRAGCPSTITSFVLSGGDGQRFVHIRAVDKLGNIGANFINDIIVDTSKPVLGTPFVFSGTTGYSSPYNYFYGSLTVGVDAKLKVDDAIGIDISSCKYTTGGAATGARAPALYVGNSTSGYCYMTGLYYQTNLLLNFAVKDKANNRATGADVLYIWDGVGPNAPFVSAPFGGDSFTTGTINFMVSTSDLPSTNNIGLSGYYYVFSLSPSFAPIYRTGITYSSAFTLTGFAHGGWDFPYYWKIYAFDKFGTSGAWSDDTYFYVDTVPPTLSFTDNVAAGPVTSDTITASRGDAIAKKWMYHTSSSCPTTEASYTLLDPIPTQTTSANNGKWICLFGKDTTLNYTTLASANAINIDSTPPTFTFNNASGPECVAGSLAITAASDAGIGLHATPYSFNGTTWSTTATTAIALQQPGTQTRTGWVRDALLNQASQIATYTFNNVAPTASNFVGGNVGNSPLTVDWKILSSATEGSCGTGNIAYSGIIAQGTKGICTQSGTTGITYTPNANQVGSDTCVIQIKDNENSTVNFTITWNNIDSILPTITTGYIYSGSTGYNAIKQLYYYKLNPDIKAEVSDTIGLNTGTCMYTVNGSSRSSASYSGTSTVGYCYKTGIVGGPDLSIRFSIRDNANNLFTGTTGVYIYDILPPAVGGDGGLSILGATKAGGVLDDRINGITTDSLGNMYVAGVFSGTATFGGYSLTSNGDSDGFVGKLNSNGIWLRVAKGGGGLEDTFTSIALDSGGNIYIAGYFAGPATFGGYGLTSNGDSDGFVGKLNNNGTRQRANKGGGVYIDSFDSIAVTSGGTVYVGGRFQGTGYFGGYQLLSNGASNNDDMFVGKLSSGGIWQGVSKGGGSSDDRIYAITLDTGGNVYVGGTFRFGALFGSIVLTGNNLDYEVFVGKLDANLTWVRAQQSLGTWPGIITSFSSVNGITVDDGGNVYVVGILDQGPVILSVEYINTLFIGKLASNGAWSRVTSGGFAYRDKITSIALDSLGDIYVAGSFVGTSMFGPYALISSGGSDLFMGKIGTNGNWRNITTQGGIGNDQINGITLTSGGNIYLGGYFSNTMTFGPDILTSSGNKDIFVGRMEQGTMGNLFVINNDASITTSRNVTLNINCPIDAGVGGEVIIYDNTTPNTNGTRTGCTATKPWTLTAGDGVKTVYMKTKDALNNISEEYTDTIYYDGSGPIVTTGHIYIGTTGYRNPNLYYKGVVSIRAGVSDPGGINPNSCQYTLDGSTWFPADFDGVYSPGICYKDGLDPLSSIDIQFRVRDLGNHLSTGATGSYLYDATAPTTTISPIGPLCTVNDILVTLTGSDGTGIGVQTINYKIVADGLPCDATSLLTYTVPFIVTGTLPNSYVYKKVCYMSTDGLGTAETIQTSNDYVIDRAGPVTPTLVTPASGYIYTATPNLLWNTTIDAGCAGVSGYTVEVHTNASCTALQQSAWRTTTGYITTPLNNLTNYYWRVRGQDTIGNTGNRSECRFMGVLIDQVVACELLPANAHFYGGVASYSITQTYNVSLPGWEPTKRAYYEDNIPNQYTCEYGCDTNYTRVGALNVNLGQLSVGLTNFRSKMDTEGNIRIAYIGYGSKLQVQKVSSTGLLLSNRVGVSSSTLGASAAIDLILDSKNKPYMFYGNSVSADKTVIELTGNIWAPIHTITGDKGRILTDYENNLYIMSIASGIWKIRDDASNTWLSGTFPSTNPDGSRIVDKNGRVVFFGTRYSYRYENGSWTEYMLPRQYTDGGRSVADDVGGVYWIGHASSKLLITYLSNAGTLTSWYFNGTNGLLDMAASYGKMAGAMDRAGNFRVSSLQNDLGVLKYNGSTRQYRTGLTIHGAIDYNPVLWESKQGGIWTLYESVLDDKLYGAYYSGTRETDVEVSSGLINPISSMSEVINTNGDTMIGYVNAAGEYVLTTPENGCSPQQASVACQDIADPNGRFINGGIAYTINQTWNGSTRLPATGSYYDDGILIVNTCEYACVYDSFYSGAVGLCISTPALVSQAYISAGTTGDNGLGTNYYKGTINIRADVSDAGGLNTSSCKYTTGSSRLTAQYNGTSTAGYCYVNSLSPGADINLRFSIQNIANNITTGAIGAYTYDATAPINGTVNINNNAEYTNTGVVTVYITDCPTDNLGIGLSGLYVGTGSNPTGGFRAGCPSTITSFVLSGGDGQRFVHIRAVDKLRNTGVDFSDDIKVKTSLPQVFTAVIYSGMTGYRTPNYYYKGIVDIHAPVSDTVGISGTTCQYTTGSSRAAASYQGTQTDGFCYKTGLNYTSTLVVNFRVRDVASNLSTGISTTYLYDGTAPMIIFTGSTPANNTTGTSNTFKPQLQITDAGVGLGQFIYTRNGQPYSVYDSGLVLMMNFDNVASLGESSSVVKDLSWYENDGTVFGGALPGNGKYGSAYTFDGINDYIDVGSGNSLDFGTGAFSIFVRAQTNTSGGVRGIIDKGAKFAPYNTGWSISYAGSPTSIYLLLGNGSATYMGYNTSLTTWTGYKLLGMIRETDGKVYFVNDGVKLYTNATFAGNITNNKSLRIGVSSHSETRFSGSIDEVRVYNRALSTGEVDLLYRSNLNKFSPTQWLFTDERMCMNNGTYNYTGYATDMVTNNYSTGRKYGINITGVYVSWPRGIDLGAVVTSGNAQTLSGQFTGYFFVQDDIGTSGWYTTITLPLMLSGRANPNLSIANSNIYFNGTGGVSWLNGTLENPFVYIHPSVYMNGPTPDYVSFSGPRHYIKRDPSPSPYLCGTGSYGNRPWMKVALPARQGPDTYSGIIYIDINQL